MCMPKPPKPDPSIKAAQKAQMAAESQRMAELKKKQLEKTKGNLGDSGVRSLITSQTGAGYGRNML